MQLHHRRQVGQRHPRQPHRLGQRHQLGDELEADALEFGIVGDVAAAAAAGDDLEVGELDLERDGAPGQQRGEQQLVPGEDECEQGDRDEARRCQGQHVVLEQPEPRGAVHLRGFFDGVRDFLEEALHRLHLDRCMGIWSELRSLTWR